MHNALRRRLSSTKDLVMVHDPHLSAPHLGIQTLLKYRDMFQPIFLAKFFEKLETQIDVTKDETLGDDAKKYQFVLKNSLSVPLATVTNLHLQPGDRHFMAWLFVSVYFPVIAACIAPLGNLISLVGLIEHWQVNPETSRTVPDSSPTFVLNVLAFVLGIVGNMSLLMNFSGKVHYFLAQCVSIFCFVVASIFLLAAVLLANARIYSSVLQASEGFWLGVFTIFMYFLCSIVLVTNVVGYKLDKYRARFNLAQKQRRLMSHTIAFSVWQAVGTTVMAKLIPGITFSTSLYYCTVSMLTIGLGDIVPTSPGAKVFALVFSTVGVLIMGLIISMLRQVILYSEGPSLFWHRIERKRLKLVRQLEMQLFNADMRTADVFAHMRDMRAKIRRMQQRRALLLTLLVFVLFWLLGALVFYYVEKWTYFNAVYFGGLCLLTIGYGDFHPEQPLGKVFFVVWAIAAVPLMTIVISNMGDTLFGLSGTVDLFAAKMFQLDTYKRLFRCSKSHVHSSDSLPAALEVPKPECLHITATENDDVDARHLDQMKLTLRIAKLLVLLKQVLRDSLDVPEKEYDYDEWMTHLRHLEPANHDKKGFWSGELSPLRLPLKESNYLLLKLLWKIEKDLQELMAVQRHTFCTTKKQMGEAGSTRGDSLKDEVGTL